MHSNVTSKNVSWPHFSWTTLYNSLGLVAETREAPLATSPGLASFMRLKT